MDQVKTDYIQQIIENEKDKKWKVIFENLLSGKLKNNMSISHDKYGSTLTIINTISNRKNRLNYFISGVDVEDTTNLKSFLSTKCGYKVVNDQYVIVDKEDIVWDEFDRKSKISILIDFIKRFNHILDQFELKRIYCILYNKCIFMKDVNIIAIENNRIKNAKICTPDKLWDIDPETFTNEIYEEFISKL